MLDLLDIYQAELQLTYYTHNLTMLQFADNLVITLEIFTGRPPVFFCHYYSLLTNSLHSLASYWLILNWLTSQLSLLFTTVFTIVTTALLSVSLINAGVCHAENAALCTVVHDVTKVT
jgi:hypothetical protein